MVLDTADTQKPTVSMLRAHTTYTHTPATA